MFKQEMDRVRQRRDRAFREMESFSRKMLGAMGLRDRDMKHQEMSWSIRGFTISIRSFPQNGWQPILVCSPGDPGLVGYSNTDESVPKGWAYWQQGTATIFYPPPAIQQEILSRIAEAKKPLGG